MVRSCSEPVKEIFELTGLGYFFQSFTAIIHVRNGHIGKKLAFSVHNAKKTGQLCALL